MRKVILTIISLFFVLLLHAQDSAKTLPFNDTTKVTFSKIYNDVKNSISAIGSALKIGTEHVCEVLVKQQNS